MGMYWLFEYTWVCVFASVCLFEIKGGQRFGFSGAVFIHLVSFILSFIAIILAGGVEIF